jgi:methylated-DNA-[protein]-cysteine S-methyltransferase
MGTAKIGENSLKYAIFKTRWGYFGLAGTEETLFRTCLPGPRRNRIESQLLAALGTGQYDKSLLRPLQQRISAYFEGAAVSFDPDIPIALGGFSRFASSVLTACREIEFGQVVTYSELGREIGRPGAARAVGNVLARNPLPLIIPCHRVVRSDGGLGGFSAPGGTDLKRRLLELEQQITGRE